MWWQELLSMPVTHITVREHGGVSVQGSHWGPFGCLEAMQNWLYSSLDVVLWRAVGISYH